MTKRQHTQQGIASLVIIPVLVVVVVLSGWYVWQRSNNTTTQTNDQNTLKNTQEQPSEAENTKPDEPIEQGGQTEEYLVISEWGVRVPLSPTVSGAYYEVDDSVEQDSGVSNITVYSDETDSIAGPAGISCAGEYIAYLLRLPADDTRWQPQEDVLDGNVSVLFNERIVLGDYRYAIATKKTYGPECFHVDKGDETYELDITTERRFNAVVEAFRSDFKNIEIVD